MKTRTVAILFALAGALVAACSSSSSNSPGSTSAAVTSCNQVCEKQDQKKCMGPITISLDDCKQLCGFLSMTSADCQAKSNERSQCELGAPDVCDTSTACKDKIDAESTACK